MNKYTYLNCNFKIFYVQPIGEIVPLPNPIRIESIVDYDYMDVNVEWPVEDIENKNQLFKPHNLFIFYNQLNGDIRTDVFECLGIDYRLFSTVPSSMGYENTIAFRFRQVDIFNLSNRIKEIYNMQNNQLARLMINSTYGLPILMAIPRIDEIYFTEPYTTIKWTDKSTTTVRCQDGEEFNKEIGVAMAITRKYFESMPVVNPRASFKELVYKKAVDQTKAVHDRKARKKKKKLERLKALEESNKEISDGDISTSKKSSS